MDSIKSKIFNYLSKVQKSELCHYISAFTKKYNDKNPDKIANLLIEEEKYYIEIDSSRHPWIEEFLEDESFYKDLILYIKDIMRKIEYKEFQKPIIEKQKAYLKEQRQFLKDKKLSKTPPTQKQISYFKALCKKYDINTEIIFTEEASRLDYKNALSILIDEKSLLDKESLINKLNNIVKSRNEQGI